MIKGGHQVHVAFGFYSLFRKAEEWIDVRMDSVKGDPKSLESLPVQDISGTALINKDPGHHEVCSDDRDNHGVVLVDGVDTLEVPIRKGDRRKTLL